MRKLRPRQLSAASLGAALISLPFAHEALAVGGRGSSGFGRSGGGGGFGGGGRSGGGGGFFFIPMGGGTMTILLIVFVIWIAFKLIGHLAHRNSGAGTSAGDRIYEARTANRRAERVETIRLAAAEAAEDDPAFAPDVVEPRAAELFEAIQLAWDRRDRAALAQLAGPDLLREWNLRLDDFASRGWHNRARIVEPPQVEYVGLVNRGTDAEDRVTVRIDCRIDDWVETEDGRIILLDNTTSKTIRLAEYWTLGKNAEGKWILLSIEQNREGEHQLDSELVVTPWADDQRLRDSAVAERAAADTLPEGMSPGDIASVSFDGPARTAAQDIALHDGRFDPALIEASVRRAVEAWVVAVDGPDEPLEAVARPEAVTALLHPGDEQGKRTRLVVRGLQTESITIVSVDPHTTPESIGVEIVASGRRYIEDRETAGVLAGSRDRSVRFTENWTLALDGTGEWPWRIAGVGAAATA